MKPLSEATALVFDHGLFYPLAERLARDGGFGRVLFFTEWQEAFPTLNRCIIGDGFDRVERCDNLFDVINDVDCFVFPDVLNGDLQVYLESIGKTVFGSRKADILETNRQKFLATLKDVGLTVPPHHILKGLSKLRTFLKENEGPFFIKVSRFRGSLETTKFRNYDEDEGLLDQWAVKFGPAKELIPFIVCDPIETELEIGADAFCIDGQFPDAMLVGDEWKDAGYLAAVRDYKDVPEQLRAVMEAFAPILEAERYRNMWSAEVRVTEDEFFFIDPCHRFSLPGTASRLELIKNLPEIIYRGANGELVQPEWNATFAAECVLTMKGDKHAWDVAEIPKELRRWVKCGSCCEIDGKLCFPPNESDGTAIGWLCAIGDTPEEAIKTLHKYADAVPDGIEADTDALVGLLKEIQVGEEAGIEFSDLETPEPETALNL